MMQIQSHRGSYDVHFFERLSELSWSLDADRMYLVDQNVYDLHLSKSIPLEKVVLFAALEENKSLEKIPDVLEKLLERGLKRNLTLITIGGGITQDVGCFLASLAFRGIDWEFFPTTLLAQADSCIGSKSSINFSSWKNILGNFNPPKRVVICQEFLKTLSKLEIRSGIGEILKIHALESPSEFKNLASEFKEIVNNSSIQQKFIRRSLELKKRWIELDEFDKGPRNLLNYGHSFGHALEAATNFAIPHGIAVTIGMDMANFVAMKLGRIDSDQFKFYHDTISDNIGDERSVHVPIDKFLQAIAKDKKNVGSKLSLILPGKNGFEKVQVPNDSHFQNLVTEYQSSKA
jgi:3-dehydroquinate synthase